MARDGDSVYRVTRDGETTCVDVDRAGLVTYCPEALACRGQPWWEVRSRLEARGCVVQLVEPTS